MRVLVCPDSFTGTMTARQAADAMRIGWLRTNVDDHVIVAPLSDGGPGFLDTAVAAHGAYLSDVTVSDPLGRPVEAKYATRGPRAWIESAQACGLHLLEPQERDPGITSTYGVGQLVAAAIDNGAQHITVGLGGSATNDAGAGALAALGATSIGNALDRGGLALAGIVAVDLSMARQKLSGVVLEIATDVDNPLCGPRGASALYGPQKGADDELVGRLDTALGHFAAICGRRFDGKDPAVALGSGAAGGLGFGLMHVGAVRLPGIATVLDDAGLGQMGGRFDLVLTGEGQLDDQSMHGKVVVGVAARAAAAAIPCVVVAGSVRIGKRELAAAGIDAAYAMVDMVGQGEAMGHPQEALAESVARVARSWGRSI